MGFFFFEILTHTTVLGLRGKGLLLPGKNVGLWLEFALFGS